MSSGRQNRAEYYRHREDQERAHAKTCTTADERADHLRLANLYARLARQAELLSGGKTP